MTKRRTTTATTKADAPEGGSLANESQSAKEEAQASAPSAEHNSMDWVMVRFSGEMGILADKVVRDGEVHRVRYWQYLRARETGGDSYELVG